MAEHVQFTIETGMQIYFCDQRAPGNAAATRTPTVSCVSTCRDPRISLSARNASSTPSLVAQYEASTDTRMDDTISGIRQRRCADRLRTQALCTPSRVPSCSVDASIV